MATTRDKIDSRGRNLLQLLEETESQMANLMNPSSRNQNTYNGPNPDDPVNISWPKINIKPTISDKDNKGINFKKFISKF